MKKTSIVMTGQDVLSQVMPVEQAGAIGRLFDCMDVAEDEIERGMEQYPEHALAVWNSFCLMLPRLDIQTVDERMYRHHCRELITRVVEQQDTRPGTVAECLMAANRASSVFPLNGRGLTMYIKLFEQVFGKDTTQALIDRDSDEMYEQWPGQVDELIADLRRRLRNDDRKAKKPSEYVVPLWWDKPEPAMEQQLVLLDVA